MNEAIMKDVTKENIEDLCRFCMPPTKRDDPGWIKGVEEKKKWAVETLQKLGSLAKLAYKDNIPVGMIQ